MGWRRFRRGFRLTDHHRDEARDFNDEVEFHHAMRERELIDSGVAPEEAYRMAREAFGDEGAIREEVARIDSAVARRRRLTGLLSSVGQDVRFGARVMVRSPLFAVVAACTLALAIGGNAVVFSLVEAVLVRAPAVTEPERLATIWTTCRAGDPRCSSSWPDFEDYRDRSTRFVDVAAYTPTTVSADVGGDPDVVGAELVSANYFSLLGVGAAAGRLLEPSDDDARADAAIMVLSHSWWRSRFGGDASVLGTTVRVNGVPYTIVGVAPAGFEGLVLGQRPDFWIPLRSLPLFDESAQDRLQARGSRWIQGLVARMADGATIDGARAEMVRISDALAVEDPDARGPRTVTVDALRGRVGDEGTGLARFLTVMQGVVALTLLLACASLANLMLARASARQAETGVRLALGAGRTRLVRQHIIESLLFASAGAILATVFASVVLRLIADVTLPGGVVIGSTGASLNAAVFTWLMLLAVVAALLAGGIPALVTSRMTVSDVLREQRSGGSTAGRLRNALIGIQVALGVVMLVGAGLFVRTLRNRLDIDLGFNADGVALVVVDPSLSGIEAQAVAQLTDRLIDRIGSLPGIQSVAAGRAVPVSAGGSGTFVDVDGYQPAPDEEMRIEYSVVTPGYLRTLGLRILAGRDFDDSATGAGEPVVIIDETMAQAWWSDRDPVGGTIHIGSRTFRVIGVANRTAWGGLEVGNTPFVFIQAGPDLELTSFFNLVVRSSGDAASILPAVRAAIRDVEPRLAIRRTASMRSEINALLAPQLTAAWLLSAFGALALALAAIGIWGVVSHSVAHRRRDFGIRMALGARREQIVALVARTTVVPVGLGLLAGILTARALSSTIRGFMYGVTGTEPSTYVIVAVTLLAVAGAATLIPARAAAATDPVRAIGSD